MNSPHTAPTTNSTTPRTALRVRTAVRAGMVGDFCGPVGPGVGDSGGLMRR